MVKNRGVKFFFRGEVAKYHCLRNAGCLGNFPCRRALETSFREEFHGNSDDLVATLFGLRFGEVSAASALVYGLVGLAGAYQAFLWKGIQRRWNGSPVMAR